MKEIFESIPMNFTSFDTHKAIKELETSGFNEGQAEAIVKSLMESRNYDLSQMASRMQVAICEDIDKLEKGMDVKITQLEEEMDVKINHLEEEKDMQKFVTHDHLKEEMAKLRTEIVGIKFDIMKWMVPIFFGVFGTLATVLIKLH